MAERRCVVRELPNRDTTLAGIAKGPDKIFWADLLHQTSRVLILSMYSGFSRKNGFVAILLWVGLFKVLTMYSVSTQLKIPVTQRITYN